MLALAVNISPGWPQGSDPLLSPGGIIFGSLIKTAKLTSWVLVILVLWMPAGCRRELSASLPAHCVTFSDPTSTVVEL